MSTLSRELGFLARQSLANCLDATSPLGKDWRGLADKMGFTYEIVTILQNRESPTLSLLEEWERQLGREATLTTLIELVESLGCMDAGEHLRMVQAKNRQLRPPSYDMCATPTISTDNFRRSPDLSSQPRRSPDLSSQPRRSPDLSSHPGSSPDLLTTPPNSLATDSAYLKDAGFSSLELNMKIEQLAVRNDDRLHRGYHDNKEGAVEPHPKQRYDIFLSFAQGDRDFAEEVKTRLQTKRLKVFIPSEDVMPGEVFSEQVADMIKQGCRKTVIILSPAYLASPWCSFESHLALHQSPDSKKHILIPILYQKCAVPSFLSLIWYADYSKYFQDPQKCEQYFWEKLYKACLHTVAA